MAKAKLKSSLFKSRFILAIFAIGFAGLGTYAIINSKAATSTGQFRIHSVEVNSSGQTIGDLPNVGFDIKSYDIGNYTCNTHLTPPQPTHSGTAADAYSGAIDCGTDPGTPRSYQVFNFTKAGYSQYGGGVNIWIYSSGVASNNTYTIALLKNPPVGPAIQNFSFTPTTLTVGANVTYNWTTTNAGNCEMRGGAPGTGQNSPAPRGPWTVQATQAGTFAPDLWCSGSGWTDAGAGNLTVNAAPPAPPPTNATWATSPVVTTPINKGSVAYIKWNANNASSCLINSAGVSWSPTNLPTDTTASGGVASKGIATPPLYDPASFTVTCKASASGGNNVTASVGVTIIGDSSAPPTAPSGGSGGGGGTPVKISTSAGQRNVARAGAIVSATDKQAPAVPTNFKAEQFGSGEVDLSWTASTDNAGIAGYTLERSTDQTTWTMLDDAIVDTTYTDSTADYNVAYTYRLSAKDTGGNFSDYALVDITTNDFTANVNPDEDSTITSDDGIVEVKFPAGALSEAAFCEISKDSVSGSPKGYKLVAGGYTVACRNAAGDSITKFDKDLEVTMHLKSYAKKYGKFLAYSVDDSSLSPIQSSYNKGTGDLTFTLSDLQTFAAFGAKKGSSWFIWLLIPLLLIGLFLLIRRLRNGGGSDDYYDTTDYVGMPPSAPVGPLDTGAGYGQHTSLPDMVAQGQQPQYPQPQYPPQQGQPQPPAQGPGPGQPQPPQYPQ